MAKSHRLTRIANPSILRSIDPALLTTFFRPHEPWLTSNGVKLAPASDIDYDRLSLLLLGAGGEPPGELLDLVCLVDDVSADKHEERLRALAVKLKIVLAADATNIDVAVIIATRNLEKLFELHTTLVSDRFRTVDRFAAIGTHVPKAKRMTAAVKGRIEDLLNTNFQKRGRDRSAVVIPLDLPMGPAALISRGDTVKRQSIVEAQQRRTLLMRPETFDMVCWDEENGDLLVRAQGKGDIEVYCKTIGLCLFGDRFIFAPDATPKRYTLHPVREHGRACLSFAAQPGIEWIELDSIEVRHNDFDGTPIRVGRGRPWEVLATHGAPLPTAIEPIQMTLKVKVEGEKRERRVRIVPPYRIECEMDDVGVAISRFLKGAGFMLPRRGLVDDAKRTLWDRD